MSDDNLLAFYEDLGFEMIDIEDDLSALSFDLDQSGNYALVTNEEGSMPESLREIILFACYTPEGSFLWSTSFRNSYLFKEAWDTGATPEEKLVAIQKHRDDKLYY
ncbi:MAG: hypothetical protein P4N59_23575 [Negativicutes bacterium]|nr:hypothetical protein [Negativicutes bacterium]